MFTDHYYYITYGHCVVTAMYMWSVIPLSVCVCYTSGEQCVILPARRPGPAAGAQRGVHSVWSRTLLCRIVGNTSCFTLIHLRWIRPPQGVTVYMTRYPKHQVI